MTAVANQPNYCREMVRVATDQTGKEWEIVRETRRTHASGCVTRWIARREYTDGEGLLHFDRITNKSGRTKRFRSEAACIAAVRGERPKRAPKSPAETLWSSGKHMDNDDFYYEDDLSAIQRDKDSTRANLSKILGVAPEAIDDLALADLWCGPTDEAVKERWSEKPWLQPGYVNDINPWLAAAK